MGFLTTKKLKIFRGILKVQCFLKKHITVKKCAPQGKSPYLQQVPKFFLNAHFLFVYFEAYLVYWSTWMLIWVPRKYLQLRSIDHVNITLLIVYGQLLIICTTSSLRISLRTFHLEIYIKFDMKSKVFFLFSERYKGCFFLPSLSNKLPSRISKFNKRPGLLIK